MFPFNLFLILILFTACASRGEKLKTKYSFPAKKIIHVEFIKQAEYHCAPAVLTMSLHHLQNQASLDHVTGLIYTPGAKGTFQNDLLAAIRRLGMIAIPVNNIHNLILEINQQNPVIIFQNLGLGWLPHWHYALVTGYDLDKNLMLLHSGDQNNFPMKISTFEKIWARVDNWGLIISEPGVIPVTASEEDMVSATTGLENSGQFDLALRSYEKILIKWERSLGALVGLGNIYYQKDNYKKSQFYLKRATELYPKAAGAWYNYSLALFADNKLTKSIFAANKAIENASPSDLETYKKSLSPIFNSN